MALGCHCSNPAAMQWRMGKYDGIDCHLLCTQCSRCVPAQVYTWGCGYSGQLGQGGRQVSPIPQVRTELIISFTRFSFERVVLCLCLTCPPPPPPPPPPQVMEGFIRRNVIVTYVTCGAYHNACLTADGDCMTWGSNAGGCLGRPGQMEKKTGDYDAEPGRVEALREYGIGEIASGRKAACVCQAHPLLTLFIVHTTTHPPSCLWKQVYAAVHAAVCAAAAASRARDGSPGPCPRSREQAHDEASDKGPQGSCTVDQPKFNVVVGC